MTVTDSPSDLILDNGDTGTSSTGAWNTSSGPSSYGSVSQYAGSGALDTYRWTPDLGAGGWYRVYAWWTSLPSRSSTVQYQVGHATGVDDVVVNHKADGGQWNELGVYYFAPSALGYVEVSDALGSGVAADAVWFERVSP